MSAAPVPAAPPHPYATHIPDRGPNFKTHKGVGQAKNAIINKLNNGRACWNMTIYRFEDGEYKPWITIQHGQHRDEIPELATPPRPKADIRWEIAGLIKAEQRYLKQAEYTAEQRRALEATL